MDTSPVVITRPMRRATWNLLRGWEAVASAHALLRPDRRWFVSIDAWDDADHDELLGAVLDDLPFDLYTVVSEADDEARQRWTRSGFTLTRREIEFVVPVDPSRTGLRNSRLPDGLVAAPADAVEEDLLRELDDTLHRDVPGSDGWRNDPGEFHDYTYDEAHFDPATYLVAIDEQGEAFAGLVRVWVSRQHARLGLIGVTRGYRRRGLARALLATAFDRVHERGLVDVTAEADETNHAVITLLESIGARRTGTTLELIRRHPGSFARVHPPL
ncbi:MAG: GNAT family N-acetyltransferase [Mycobacterium sp.]|nr:GNAT family N-acetyltransferase [Mycobacterium sp.]